jgi:enterochelin esterase-like enzyme
MGGLATVCALAALERPLTLERLLGERIAARAAPASTATTAAPIVNLQALPQLRRVSNDAAGSSIDAASYPSAALSGTGSFLVYLPAGYASSQGRYPVLYLLHGNDQSAGAFLEIGLQRALDRLISSHAVPPLIAVMIQGGKGANNWRNTGRLEYETYVLEVQTLVDQMLATLPDRDARAIAGDSMGGYGAMKLALDNPQRFGAVESWLGFFNGLEGTLRADRPTLARLGLRAFVYGGASDQIADPSENPPFAAALRMAGASAHSAIYAGGHSLETLHDHLAEMLTFAGRALAAGGPVSDSGASGR